MTNIILDGLEFDTVESLQDAYWIIDGLRKEGFGIKTKERKNTLSCYIYKLPKEN